jgi:fructose 1,6-bisphosphatase
MTHTKGVDNKEIHSLAWDTFCKATEKARDLVYMAQVKIY